MKCDHFMKCQLNQEMLWPTSRQKQLFEIHAQYGQHGTSLKVIVFNPSILAVRLSSFGPTGPLQGVSSKFTWD